MSIAPVVFVVDDDAAVRDSLRALLEVAGYAVEPYSGAEAFLSAYDPQRPGCLLLDLQMPGMGGLELQSVFTERRVRLPIIFLTGYGTVSTAVRSLNRGAFDFLEKPVEGDALLARVAEALRIDAERRRDGAVRDAAQARCAALTPREREMLPLVAAGHSSKEIARRFGISHRTVELHRTRIMHKTGAGTVIELAAMAQACGLTDTPQLGEAVRRTETR